MNATFTDRDGDTWVEVAGLLRDTDTGRLLGREEVEAFFGPLVENTPA